MTDKTLLTMNGILCVALVALTFLYVHKPVEVTTTYNYPVQQVVADSNVTNKEYVYSMCNESRVYDTVSEELCGELLDYYSFDFVCQNANKNLDNPCQIEEI